MTTNKSIILWSCELEIQHGFHKTKIKMLTELVPSGTFLPFLASRGATSLGSWTLSPSSKLAIAGGVLLTPQFMASAHSSASVCHFWRPFDCTGMSGYSRILCPHSSQLISSLHSVCPRNPPCQVHYQIHGFGAVGCRHIWGPLLCLPCLLFVVIETFDPFTFWYTWYTALSFLFIEWTPLNTGIFQSSFLMSNSCFCSKATILSTVD